MDGIQTEVIEFRVSFMDDLIIYRKSICLLTIYNIIIIQFYSTLVRVIMLFSSALFFLMCL